MEYINGEYIMTACEEGDPGQLRCIVDLYALIDQIGFLPLFANKVKGFSVEEHVSAGQWWTGDELTDPWEWRQIAAGQPDIAYGKFFDKKAGFISKNFFPAFVNYRRDGYDFDALFEDEKASYQARKVMDVFDLDERAV